MFLQHYHWRSSILHNYFDSPTKLFLDLYLIKVLDTSAKFIPLYIYFLKHDLKYEKFYIRNIRL